MPPAFILSHDQTLKFMSDPRPGGITEWKAAHLREPDLHIKLRVVIGHASTQPLPAADLWSGLLLSLATDTLRLSDEEPPPTCPFILTNNVKERKQPTPWLLPFFKGRAVAPGDLMTAAVATGRTGVRRCGDTHLGGASGAVNAFLHFFDGGGGNPLKRRLLRPGRRLGSGDLPPVEAALSRRIVPSRLT